MKRRRLFLLALSLGLLGCPAPGLQSQGVEASLPSVRVLSVALIMTSVRSQSPRSETVPLDNGSIAFVDDVRQAWREAAAASLHSAVRPFPVSRSPHPYSGPGTTVERIIVRTTQTSPLPGEIELHLRNQQEAISWHVAYDVSWPEAGGCTMRLVLQSSSVTASGVPLQDPWGEAGHQAVLGAAHSALLAYLRRTWLALRVTVPQELAMGGPGGPVPGGVSDEAPRVTVRTEVESYTSD